MFIFSPTIDTKRVSTGESYNAIMHDCQIQPPYCDLHKGGAVDPNSGNCGYKEVAPLLFVLVMLGINYMLLNLLIAVILDNFMETQSMSESKVTDEHFESFDDAWSLYDYNADGMIESNLVPALITRVLYPLGLKDIPLQNMHGITIRKHAKQMTQTLNCPVIHGMVAFASLRSAMNAHAMGDMDLPEDASVVQDLKKLHHKKAGAGIIRKIEEKQRKKTNNTPKFRRSSSIKNSNSPVENHETKMEVEEEAKRRESAYEKSKYTLGHTVACVSTQALARGFRTRNVIRRWRTVTAHAKVSGKIHPSLRTRHMLTDNNFIQLNKGVSSIKQRVVLGKLAASARARLEEVKVKRKETQERGGSDC